MWVRKREKEKERKKELGRGEVLREKCNRGREVTSNKTKLKFEAHTSKCTFPAI